MSGWAETPKVERLDDDTVVIAKQAQLNASAKQAKLDAATAASKKRSRWDETPMGSQTPSQMTPSQFTPNAASLTPSHMSSATPTSTVNNYGGVDMTPSMSTPAGIKAMNMQTPAPHAHIPMTPEQMQAQRWEREIDERNRPFGDEELDQLFPAGYKILPPPDGYVPIRTPARKLQATPTPMQNQMGGMLGGFKMMATPDRQGVANLLPDYQPQGANLPLMKPDDLQYFNKLLEDIDEDTLPLEEQKGETCTSITSLKCCHKEFFVG